MLAERYSGGETKMTAKQKILNASLELFIEKGFHGTSTKMILEKSGTSNGGLYHHFKTKEDIVQEIYYRIKTEMLDNVYQQTKNTKSIREFIWESWKANIEWALANPQKKLFVDMFSKTPIIRNCTDDKLNLNYDFVTDIFKKGIKSKELIDQNINYIIYHFMGATDSVIGYLSANPSENSEEFLEDKFKLYWRSIINI